jgi:hypothetical protein
MTLLALPFFWIAVAGFAASVVVHLCSLVGVEQPFGRAAWGLHVGIFVVWLPAILVSQKLTKGARQAEFWKAVLRGCPAWTRRALYVLFAYTFVNFFVGIAAGHQSDADNLRIFSGHWMLFYGAGAAMLYSAHRLGPPGVPRCPLGHEVSPFAKFCDECGAPLPPRLGG